MAYLEKKIDMLISQSSGKPAFQERGFSRPPRPFRRFHKHRQGQHNPNSGEGNFSSSQPRHFGNTFKDSNQGFARKKKRFFHQGKG
jgi:hypothetical protein